MKRNLLYKFGVVAGLLISPYVFAHDVIHLNVLMWITTCSFDPQTKAMSCSPSGEGSKGTDITVALDRCHDTGCLGSWKVEKMVDGHLFQAFIMAESRLSSSTKPTYDLTGLAGPIMDLPGPMRGINGQIFLNEEKMVPNRVDLYGQYLVTKDANGGWISYGTRLSISSISVK